MTEKDITIECPQCGESFHLTSALAAPMLEVEREKINAEAKRHLAQEREAIEARAKSALEAEYAEERKAAQMAAAERDKQVKAARDAELAALKAKEAAENAQRDVALQVQREVEARRAQISRKAAEDANAEVAAKVKGIEADLAAKDVKLQQAQKAEIEARRLKVEAEEAKREAELLIARKLDEERAKVREAAFKERDDEHRLKVAEKDRQLDDMRHQIEELRRKGDSGSQQVAGDVLELDLLEVLKKTFPVDRFERVGKGQNGGDLIQTVMSSAGNPSGAILWECKRTKNWQNQWLPKLREDQRAAKADIALLVTEAMPSEVATFGQLDGVWVTCLQTLVPVAQALRQGLLEVAATRRAGALADTAKDKVFDYLTTPPFRQRMTRIVEAYEELRSDLDKEKKAMNALWSRREKQLDRVLGGVTGFYGDLQGIAGSSMPTLESLELPSLELDEHKPRLAMVSGSDVVPANDTKDA